MKNILLLPVFRFGDSLTSITIRTVEIYSRINKKDFNFIINLDLRTYNQIDTYYYEKIKNMDQSFGYAGKNIIKLLKGFRITLKSAKKTDYIIGETEYFYSVVYAYIIHILARKPLIITIHQMEPDMYQNYSLIHNKVYRFIFKRTNRLLILNNNEIIDQFKNNFKCSLKLFKITNGVNTVSFYTIDRKKYDLIYIGNIEDRKNAFLLPNIIEILKSKNKQIKLLIISHLGEVDKLKEIIKIKHLEENVDFINYVTEEEKREYLAQSKVMVFPTKYEGTGIVILEAMASFLPIVLFDVPSLKIFNKGVLKATPFNLDEYVENISLLLENENIRRKLGENGRKEVKSRFDYKIVAGVENESIKEALNF